MRSTASSLALLTSRFPPLELEAGCLCPESHIPQGHGAKCLVQQAQTQALELFLSQ